MKLPNSLNRPPVSLGILFSGSRIVIAGLILSASYAHAQTVNGSWNSNGGGNWSDTTKWVTTPVGGVPDGEGSVVDLTANYSGGGKFITIDTTSRTVGALSIGDTDSFSSVTLNASGGATLTFNGAGSSNATITKSFGTLDTISAPILLGSGLDITNNDDSDLVLSGQVSGGHAITIKGTGRTTLTGTAANSSFTGGVTVESGTFAISTISANMLGSGTLTMKGGTFRGDVGSNLFTVSQNLSMEGDFSVTSGSGGVTFSGSSTVNGNVTISASSGGSSNGRNTTFSNISGGTGDITLNATTGNSSGQGIRIGSANHTGLLTNASTGGGAVVVTGVLGSNITGVVQDSATSLMRLQGANTYTSQTQVKAGTLEVTGTINNSSGVSITGGTFLYGNNTTALNRNVTLNGGEFRYNSTQMYSGALTFTSGRISGTGNLSGTSLVLGAGQTISPGNSPGTMTTGSEVWEAGGTYLWEINALSTSVPAGAEGTATGWDLLVINGSLTITAGDGEFNLSLDSLGALNNWDNESTYQWRIATASGGVSGFDPATFNIDTAEFAVENSLGGGTFSVSNVGNNIYLNFTPIPEPSVSALFAMAGLAIVLRRRRTRGI